MNSYKFLLFLIVVPYLLFAQNQLFIPDTISGSSINLTLQHGSVNFFPGSSTVTMGVNGDILGPTLILNKNHNVTINVHNQLMETTTIHWHGLHVSPQDDGGPHIFIQPGDVWSPEFTVMDWAATYWYHPHLHHHTNEHVSKGIAGFIIVRDETEAALNLPRTYGIDDIPLAVQTKSFDTNNQILIENAADTVLMVNATIDPYVNLPAQVVRLRLLNGSSERAFNFGLTNNQQFHQIASDGGLLTVPVPLTRLLLVPGERAEILVNLTSFSGQTLQLVNYGSEIPSGIYGAAQPGIGPGQVIPGYSLNPLNGANRTVLTINVTPAIPNPVTTIPADLVTHSPWSAVNADTSRSFLFTATAGPGAILGPFRINGAFFDMEIINEFVALDNLEIWELRNQTPIAHPFHIHGVQFYILDINGVPPPANMAGRKDVVLVRGGNSIVRFITKFETFSDETFPFMYHCHMLTHEDDGMMGQFLVLEDPIPVELHSFTAGFYDNNVILHFSTASEINNTGFEIQRKTFAKDWENIGFVEGSGTITTRRDYIYIDSTITSDTYQYRLKQIDSDGTYEYSNIVEVAVTLPSLFSLAQNFPNPFNPETIISFSLPSDGNFSLQVFNLLGELVQTLIENEYITAGTHKINFNANNLPAGVYIYRLLGSEYVSSMKMMLIK